MILAQNSSRFIEEKGWKSERQFAKKLAWVAIEEEALHFDASKLV